MEHFLRENRLRKQVMFGYTYVKLRATGEMATLKLPIKKRIQWLGIFINREALSLFMVRRLYFDTEAANKPTDAVLL